MYPTDPITTRNIVNFIYANFQNDTCKAISPQIPKWIPPNMYHTFSKLMIVIVVSRRVGLLGLFRQSITRFIIFRFIHALRYHYRATPLMHAPLHYGARLTVLLFPAFHCRAYAPAGYKFTRTRFRNFNFFDWLTSNRFRWWRLHILMQQSFRPLSIDLK